MILEISLIYWDYLWIFTWNFVANRDYSIGELSGPKQAIFRLLCLVLVSSEPPTPLQIGPYTLQICTDLRGGGGKKSVVLIQIFDTHWRTLFSPCIFPLHVGSYTVVARHPCDAGRSSLTDSPIHSDGKHTRPTHWIHLAASYCNIYWVTLTFCASYI